MQKGGTKSRKLKIVKEDFRNLLEKKKPKSTTKRLFGLDYFTSKQYNHIYKLL